MKNEVLRPRFWIATMCWLFAGVLSSSGQDFSQKQFDNPVSKLARILNPKLVQVEDRALWLDREVFTLAKYGQFPLKYGVGYRGCRRSKNAPDPTIIMDLGKAMPIESIYLIPTQSEYLNDYGIFPKRFKIEVSNTPDFTTNQLVYRSNGVFRQTGGAPVEFLSQHSGRYIRLSVQEGHNKGANDLFGLSEFFVLSGGLPVSFNASITTTGNIDIEGLWYPGTLNDGRSPLGIWHHGLRAEDTLGDAVLVPTSKPESNEQHFTAWKGTLPHEATLDRIVLFPYQISRSYEASFFPQSLLIEVYSDNEPNPIHVETWENPIIGINHMTPLVFPMHVENAHRVSITATRPWTMGNRSINALSEIEAWSGGQNILRGVSLDRHYEGQSIKITALTDGFSSEKNISPIDVWLKQLTRRGKIEAELSTLRSIYSELSSNTELNVSWGSAVILGLTFLIPVFFVERKRMKSKEHLDIIRKRIASDLHDDIGSNLGSISLIARTARKDLARLHGPIQIDDDLGEVEMIARESSLAMRDIVWLLERKQDSIGDLVHRMRETAGRLMREIHFTLECSSTRTASKLTLDAKRHLFLFYKEAIHNIIKHSQANRVAIKLWDEDEQLGLEILDNGVGLPVTKDRVSISIKKLEDRAEVLNGILQITSSAETGTCIRLLVKRAYLTSQPKSS